MLVYTPFPNLSVDDQRDLLKHLIILCYRTQDLDRKLLFIRNICLPALKKHGGEVTNSLDFLDLAQNHGFSPTEIGQSVTKYFNEMKKWLSTSEAAKYMGCSVRKIQRLAKQGIPFLEVTRNDLGHYKINVVSIDDLMIRTKQVQIT